MNDLLEEINDL